MEDMESLEKTMEKSFLKTGLVARLRQAPPGEW